MGARDYVYELDDDEFFWMAHQSFLLSRGYKLRPRYDQKWIGSWKYNGKLAPECEDSRGNMWWNVLDAVRIEDNVKVTLKLVRTTTQEIPVALYLSSEALLSDPRNRTVHILDVITLHQNDRWALLVMPFLRDCDDPPFQFRAECVEFLTQMFQGLEFMHEHNVTHRDACHGNIMMDATKVIPGGFHHVIRNTHDGMVWDAPNITCRSRLSVAPVDYFYIDFGLSLRFSSYEERSFVIGKLGKDKTAPELSDTVPYNPFALDIYQLGGVIHLLVETYHGLELFRPLASAMMRADPPRRPTASEALRHFEDIISKLGPHALKTRVVLYEDYFPARMWRVMRKLCWPRPR